MQHRAWWGSLGASLMTVGLAAPAWATTSATWAEIGAEVSGFTGLMFVVGGALIVIGGVYMAVKWWNTREFGEGLMGLVGVAIGAIFLSVVVPRFTAAVNAQASTLNEVTDTVSTSR